MKVIMLKDVDKVGDKHELITVKNGFGRNYLIPQGLAIIASKSNMGRRTEMLAREEAQEQKRLDDYKEMATKIRGKELPILAKAGTSGKIFGSITPLMVSTHLQNQYGIEVPRRKIVMPESAKELGEYPLTIKFHQEVTAEMTLILTDKEGKKPEAPKAAAEEEAAPAAEETAGEE